MIMKKIWMIVLCSTIMWSCSNTSPQHDGNSETTETHEHHESSDVIELNNGEKWQVNEEMRPYVEKGEALVENYIHNNDTDFKSLAVQLKKQNELLINSCTMDGKSHEELHKWLHPHLELVKQLEDENDADKAANLVKKLKESYNTYHSYFK